MAKGGSSSALAATDNSNYNGDASTVVVDQQRTSLTSTTSQSPPSATAADADQQPLSSSSDETTSNLGGAKSNVNLLSSSSSNNNNFSSPSTAADGFSSSANGNELAAQNQLVPHSSASNLLESLDHSNIQGDIIERGQDYEFLNGDEYEPEPAARVLASPVPELNEGFIFMNVDYEADPDTPVIALATALSRSASLDDVGAAASSLAATLDGSSTPLLRPSTPDKLELQRDAANHHGTHQMDGGDSSFHGQHGQTSTIANTTTAAGGAGNAGRSSFANDSIALESVPVYDREALILSIRQELDIKEKHSSKNLTLQNKLGDYFKKKRVRTRRMGGFSWCIYSKRVGN